MTAFVRLARVHALSAAGDAMIAVALADSLFFSVDPGAARSKVLLYLFLTLTPFAIVAPSSGPPSTAHRAGGAAHRAAQRRSRHNGLLHDRQS